ncbi:hypothetical protein [Plesiocystis pacifica]|uniref:hypothetical protein n=1 Tax=Plesiocystis pacifica TaxID=191768 RepID=UPI0012FBFA19|nr:hypothetical protein [Plesiocystis pacifica]
MIANFDSMELMFVFTPLQGVIHPFCRMTHHAEQTLVFWGCGQTLDLGIGKTETTVRCSGSAEQARTRRQ